jgi:hypothetical protein
MAANAGLNFLNWLASNSVLKSAGKAADLMSFAIYIQFYEMPVRWPNLSQLNKTGQLK